MDTFGNRLKSLRREAGLTQAQFSEKVGVHLQTVSKWERGVSEPDFSVLGEIAAALGISLDGGGMSSSDLALLARCVYAESRGEPYTGQVAVAAVVLNRVRSSKFPNTVAGVIYQPGAFTCVSDGQINLSADSTARSAAQDALNGWDPTNGCLYYYNPATATSKWIWSLKVELTIGRHSFARG